ncbi:MAG: diacylglycerol kinase family lipid kinase [Gemella sp.]|nr:diacylglycerol kinase family lipid kinase [Gemella sp.]
MKKATLIINPSSGGEKAKKYEKLTKEKLESFFDIVDIKYTEKAGDATVFAKNAAKEKHHSVFVMGGDGTVNEGISGIAELDYRPNFGFFPLGTVNDLARALKIPLNPEQAIKNFNPDNISDLDIGKINNSYFMNVVAIGTIPESINNVDSKEKTRLGKVAYFVSGAKELMNTGFYDFELSIDNSNQQIKTSTILIGLTNSIGGFETMFPKAKVNDGKLHLAYIKDTSLLDTVLALPELLHGIDKSSTHIEYFTSSNISVKLINSTDKLSVNVDGDEGDSLPVSIKILPSHLKVYK